MDITWEGIQIRYNQGYPATINLQWTI